MAWVVGRSAATGRIDSGRISSGIINPPRSIEGRKMSCDHNTTARALLEVTPIRAPMAPKVRAVSKESRANMPQLTGVAASNSGPAVMAMMDEAISAWNTVVRVGTAMIDVAGTPLIL